MDCVRPAVNGGSGSVGMGVHFTCHFLSHIFPSLWPVLHTVGREKCGKLTIRIHGKKLRLYIYKKELKWRPKFCLVPRSVQFSSFWKKGIVQKKKESLLFRSVPLFSSFVQFRMPGMHSSFQRRLVTLENVFNREMKSEWMHSSIQRRLVTLENVFDREMNCECIHHFREDWLLWRTFLIGKWIVNVFIISEKIGYSGERFRSGNELWMYSSFQRRLVTLENVLVVWCGCGRHWTCLA